MAQKILVVDDEQPIADILQFNLEKEGYQVICAYDGDEATRLAENEKPDLILLDIMLPNKDGNEVLREVRKTQTMPIIMLTAKDSEIDKVLGLELGADDYLTKPFSPKEVIARIKAILRRTRKSNQNSFSSLKIGGLTIYPERYEAEINSETITFTRKEFELLYFLAKNKGKVISRDQLLSGVWDYDFVGDTRIVDVHISHLRDKIEPDTKKPIYIKTIRGLGYKLEEPV